MNGNVLAFPFERHCRRSSGFVFKSSELISTHTKKLHVQIAFQALHPGRAWTKKKEIMSPYKKGVKMDFLKNWKNAKIRRFFVKIFWNHKKFMNAIVSIYVFCKKFWKNGGYGVKMALFQRKSWFFPKKGRLRVNIARNQNFWKFFKKCPLKSAILRSQKWTFFKNHDIFGAYKNGIFHKVQKTPQK